MVNPLLYAHQIPLSGTGVSICNFAIGIFDFIYYNTLDNYNQDGTINDSMSICFQKNIFVVIHSTYFTNFDDSF